jgi:hypothetical protein
MGIEPTASRVRCEGDGPSPKDFAKLERQKTSGSVSKRPILATRSQNSERPDRVAEPLAKASQAWSPDRDPRELRKVLLAIMALLDE